MSGNPPTTRRRRLGDRYDGRLLRSLAPFHRIDGAPVRVNDERICDGHYYASAFKLLLALLRHPERLETPPAAVVEDVE